MKIDLRFLVLVSVFGAAACGDAMERTDTSSQALGSMLWWTQSYGNYGISLNGQALNGKTLDGHAVSGVSFAGVVVGGKPAGKVRLDGTVFHGIGSVGSKSFAGATFVGQLDDGDAITLRVEDMIANEERANSDVWLYRVTYATQDGWRPLCGLDAGQPMLSIPVEGRWDYRVGVAGGGSHIDDSTAFTFACRHYAIAKCVELGYKPWGVIKQCPSGTKKCAPTSVAELHQACVRALRADYCGDGSSSTIDGTTVNVYDAFGYHIDEPSWAFEAEWTASGARCATRLRVPSMSPSCWSSLYRADCGSATDFAETTLLMTQQAP